MNNKPDTHSTDNRPEETDEKTPVTTPDDRKESIRKDILDYVKIIAIVLIVMFVLQKFIIVNARIPSASMEPTIMTNDQIFGNRLAYLNSNPKRYDIVIFRYPDDESRLFIKRVIGLPGETVDIRNGDVYINGNQTPLDDSFCALPDSTDTGDLTFPLPFRMTATSCWAITAYIPRTPDTGKIPLSRRRRSLARPSSATGR